MKTIPPAPIDNSHKVLVDVIIPVYNAEATLEATVQSAMRQQIPQHLEATRTTPFSWKNVHITVCCYDDVSSDNSWPILEALKRQFDLQRDEIATYDTSQKLISKLLIYKSDATTGGGAGLARNRAVDLQSMNASHHFLCLLDSDDTMHPYRIAEQLSVMMKLPSDVREKCLLGSQFVRDPPDSTWHYTHWANNLSDEMLLLERFREVTILQPTWFLCRSRFQQLGGYVEAPEPSVNLTRFISQEQQSKNRLVHSKYDTHESLRLAEDLRFFHDHLDTNGTVKLHRTREPLVTYRHTGTSQSFRTSRRLLLQLRALAFQRSILRCTWIRDVGSFIIWGAGRDGKEFFKSLDKDLRQCVYAFVDVDEKKLKTGHYVNRELDARVPIIHFSFLIKDMELQKQTQSAWESGGGNSEFSCQITKARTPKETDTYSPDPAPPPKKRKEAKRLALDSQGLHSQKLRSLPVVVCVAKYRTNGALERNVKMIDRREGEDLWYFS